MNYIAVDNETFLIQPGTPHPKMVCLSIAIDTDEAEVIHRNDPLCERRIREALDACFYHGAYLVGANIAFDLGVWVNEWPDLERPVWRLYDEGRVIDVLLRQKLHDIAEGDYRYHYDHEQGKLVQVKYNLETVARLTGYPTPLDKDTWRLRYGELYPLPVGEWPQGAIDYSAHDSRAALWACLRQDGYMQADAYFRDQHRQVSAEWALHLTSSWGLRTDPVMVERYREQVTAVLTQHEKTLADAGFLTYKKDKPHKEQKKALEYVERLWSERGVTDYPKTPTGKPQLDEDAVLLLDDPLMIAYQAWSSARTAHSHVEELARGIEYPIHTRYETLAETGRTTSSNPNVQNRPNTPGDRECFVPRPGNVFIDIDFDMLELHTWAQCCKLLFGYSDLAEVLNAGGDPHSDVAASILGIDRASAYARKKNKGDKDFSNARQSGKIANFGFPGGMGINALRIQAKKLYGVSMTPEETQALKRTWLNTWREARAYFAWISRQCDDREATLKHFFSERFRGGLNYTAACNTLFQGLGADSAKLGLVALVRACQIGSLRGCRVANFVHDQTHTEVPREFAREAGEEVQRIWCEASSIFVPDCPNTATPVACARWSKLAGDDKCGVIIDGVWEWSEAIKAGAKGCVG